MSPLVGLFCFALICSFTGLEQRRPRLHKIRFVEKIIKAFCSLSQATSRKAANLLLEPWITGQRIEGVV